MMHKGVLFFWTAVAFVFSLALAPIRAQVPELIPREVLFGNPLKSTPRLSPDGRRLAYLAPSEKGVMNIRVRILGKEEDVQVTSDSKRGIRTYFWAEDNKHLLYIQDLAGDENYHVYSTDLESLVTRDLTPFLGIRAQNILTDKHHPDEILVGLNLRDRRIFDMYRINLTTGAVALDARNQGDVVGWVTDPNFVIRAAIASQNKDGSTILRVRDSVSAPWRTIGTWPFGEDVSVIDFSQDGASLLLETSIGSDTSRLARMDAATGKELETIAADPRCDLGEVMLHPDTRKVEAVSFSYLKPEWKVLDSGM
ncbi:MAG: S9 family peptidase, partial [Armatimonadetes bacterium]|nr:S9 family peptidase [Armatimonadota bacterium]